MSTAKTQTDKATANRWTVLGGTLLVNPAGRVVADFDKPYTVGTPEFWNVRDNAEAVRQQLNEHAALVGFVQSIAKMEVEFTDAAVFESLIAQAKELTAGK